MTEDILPPSGILKNNVFYYPARIYYEDTDAGGIVYYANYLKFAERARSEFLRYLKINQQQILQELKQGFVVRSCNIEYLASAVLDDNLLISCKIIELTPASVTIEQEIMRNSNILCQIKVKLIYMSLQTHRPTRIHQEITEKFTSLKIKA